MCNEPAMSFLDLANPATAAVVLEKCDCCNSENCNTPKLYENLEEHVDQNEHLRRADALNRANIINTLRNLKQMYCMKGNSCTTNDNAKDMRKYHAIAAHVQKCLECYQHAHFEATQGGKPRKDMFAMTREVDKIVDEMANYELMHEENDLSTTVAAFKEFLKNVQKVCGQTDVVLERSAALQSADLVDLLD